MPRQVPHLLPPKPKKPPKEFSARGASPRLDEADISNVVTEGDHHVAECVDPEEARKSNPPPRRR
jgi:hypothetical protein